MKILIVKPKPHPGTIRMERLVRCEPLELEYLYTVLKKYDLQIIDGVLRKTDPVAHARRMRPDIVLFTAYIIDIPAILKNSLMIKRRQPHIRIFVGGVHAEVCPEHFESPFIDGVFYANHLTAVATVVERIENNSGYDDVPGLALRKKNVFTRNPAPAGAVPDLQPDRVLFSAAPHRFNYLFYSRCASVKTASGCTGRCTFCFCRAMNGGVYTPRPIGEVVDEIASFDAETIFLLDDNFLIDTQRLMTFADLILERGIRRKFIAYGTAAYVAHNEPIIKKLKSAGLDTLIIGLEYTDDDDLQRAGKVSTLDDNDRAIKILSVNDINLFALFMVSPGWKREKFSTLERYITSRRIRFATFSTETPYPGTAAFEHSYGHAAKDHAWWRFDLLRVHGNYSSLSLVMYYVRLYRLYMLPALYPGSVRWMIRRCGFLRTLKMVVLSGFTGAEYLLKLLVWR